MEDEEKGKREGVKPKTAVSSCFPFALSRLTFFRAQVPGKVLLLALAAGCGYHLVGTSSNLAPSLQALYVAPLINQTARSEVDQRLTEQITQEWVRRGRFQLVSSGDKADAVISGTVKSAIVNPVQFDQQGRATQYQLTVTIDIQLVDRTGEEQVVLWRDEQFSRNTAYPVDPLAKDYFDREVEAMDTLSRSMARDLVTTILEGF